MRILLAKGGLDGHPRGLKILARFLRDAGFEVIYLGMYQPAEMIASAAIQEDPDIIGVSMHSGGHKKVFRKLMKMLADAKCDSAVVAGGIIPRRDYKLLKRLGVRLIFCPRDSMQGKIIPALQELASENKSKDLPKIFSNFSSPAAYCHVIGFTGSGGVGKSSIISALLKHVYSERRVAAIFVDPVAISGGAVLGDRVRAHRPENFKIVTSPNVFMKSLAAKEVWKGVTPETPAVIDAVSNAGFEIIFVETVGAPQYDLGFKDVVDTMVYVITPASGDEIQISKGGAIETADIIVLNKSDQPRSEQFLAVLKKNFPGKPVISTGASLWKNNGIPELWKTIESLKQKPL